MLKHTIAEKFKRLIFGDCMCIHGVCRTLQRGRDVIIFLWTMWICKRIFSLFIISNTNPRALILLMHIFVKVECNTFFFLKTKRSDKSATLMWCQLVLFFCLMWCLLHYYRCFWTRSYTLCSSGLPKVSLLLLYQLSCLPCAIFHKLSNGILCNCSLEMMVKAVKKLWFSFNILDIFWDI